MRSFHHIQSGITGTDPWMIVVILGGIFLLIFLLIMIIRRGNIGSNGLTPVEKKTLSREQKEVLAMLRQHGGSIVQTEVADNIAGDISYVVELLTDLENKGKINRHWDANKMTYLVSAVT